MTTTEVPVNHRTGPSPAQAFGIVLDAAVGTVAAKLERKAAGWIDKLGAVAGQDASTEGAAQRAAIDGVEAHLDGRNPAWAAVKGAWQAGTPAVRAAIVTSAVAAVVVLLLSPALLLVYLLSWLVIAAVYRSRDARRRRHVTAGR